MRPPPIAIWIASLCALLTAVTVRAQAPQSPPAPPAPPVIHSIDVEYTGPASISKERILAQMRTKVGQIYSNEIVQEDIKALYGTGYVRNVRIFAQPQGDGVKVIVAVQTQAVLREIEINGAERVKPKRLRKEMKVRLNQAVNEQALEEARQKIIEIYQGKGYNDVSVEYRVEPIDEKRGTARVIFTVTEGVKGAISEIRFEGNAHISQKILRKQMKTRGRTLIYFVDKTGRLDEVQLEQDLDKVREYYQNHGFIDVAIKEVRKDRTPKGPMIITIVIAEGPQYHVSKLSITGYEHTTDSRVRAFLKMKEGSVYSPKQLHDDAKAVADAYGSGGYVDLVITPEGTPAGPALIDVHYLIEEGPRSFVNRVNIEGNTRTKDKVIRREVLVAPGDVFNTVRVDTTKKRLENLGYFAKVETYPEDTDIPGRKDLTVLVQEKRTGSLSFGGGFSTVDKLVGFAELTQGNFDMFNWPSFTGGGQKFRLRIQYGTERKDFILAITEPYFLDRRLSLSGQAFYNEANYLSAEYNQRNYGVLFELRKPINAYMYGTLGYMLQDVDIFDVDPTASEFIQSQKGSSVESKILSSLVFDSRDNPLLSRRGQRITFSPMIAGGFLGGDTQIYAFDLEGSQYFRLPKDTILLINGEISTVSQWGSGTQVPIYERLFLGGSNNLRGFPFREVGPQDENGEPVGGQSLARATFEWTFPIIEKARGALFYDMGFVNSSAWSFGFNHMASDVGVGIRLDLPIGPLRLDYGYPVMRDGYNGGGHFNFNVGYQF
ncbi:MAG TPA: outer membrane protein assembly factor BamA [Candidatus Udaeobacter sp.]|jgi:outer membrane protein insertion porin family|nr:outer membrane protein assembly factor BamA [Candidatus Udaeobacter sp.]